jgi:hypothetical protein
MKKDPGEGAGATAVWKDASLAGSVHPPESSIRVVATTVLIRISHLLLGSANLYCPVMTDKPFEVGRF